MIVEPGGEFVEAWVAQRVGVPEWGPCTSLVVLSEDRALMGGVIFHQFDEQNGTIQLSAAGASRKWLSRAALCAIFSYPFIQLNVARITCCTGKKNREARQFLEKFGFKLEGCIRRGLKDQDLMLYGLLRSEWKEGRFGQKVRTSTASSAGPGSAGERAIVG